MRQAGVLAAAGLVALEESPAKLATDHENARLFASLLGLPTSPPTNIVVFDVSYTGRTPAQIAGALKAEGVLVSPVAETVLRAVTHQDVSAEECRAAAGIVRRVLTSGT